MELTMTMSLDETEQTFDQLFDEEPLLLGPEGKSAYEVAVKNGFKGTEQEWLDSLKGEPGKDYELTPEDKAEIAEMAAELVDAPGGPGDLTGYATEEYVQEYAQPKGEYLDASDLPEAVNTALALAKESGAFDGEEGLDGLTPIVEVQDNYSSNIGSGVLVKVMQPYRTPGSDLINYDIYEVPIYHGTDGKDAKILSINVESIAAGATPSATVSNTPAGAIISMKIPKGDPGSPGKDGAAGEDGSDGFSPTVGISKSGKVTTVTVVDKNGAKSATINDGADGVSATHSWNGTTLTVTSASGTSSANLKGDKGDKGDSIKGDPGDDGADGQRGHGFLKVTTTPTSYTTTTGGKTPIKRMSLSTIKSEAKVDEVLVGDQICHSYYLYNVYYLDATYAYMDKSQSIRGATGSAGSAGKDGTSVTITSVVESEESGGENVVTFSDGKALTVRNGKGESAPDYVVAEARGTAKKVLSHQSEDCFTLAWLSDIHIGNSYQIDGVWTTDETSNIEAGMGLHEMNKTAPCDMIALGGDLAAGTIMTQHDDGLNQLDTAMEYMRPATFHTPTLYLVGNHDDVPFRATADRLTRAELFSRFGKKSLLTGAVSNDLDKGCNYGYLDFENRKMRVIYLDTHDKNGWESTNCVNGETTESAYMNACNVSAKQLHWLANVALDFSDKKNVSDWGVVVLSHTQLNIHSGNHTYTDATSGKTYTANTDNVITILTAYLSKGSGSVTLNGETATYDFTGVTEKAYLYCCINGHRHCYEFREYGGKKIPGITCPNTRDGSERESQDGNTYTKTPGTGESCSFNVITIDRKNGKIYADNHGAGIDRVFDVVVYAAYTNLVPTAITPPTANNEQPSTEIYNGGLGYMNGMRISSMSNIVAASGYVTTGVMTWRENPGAFSGLKPIYIKGAELDITKSYVRMCLIHNIDNAGLYCPSVMNSGENWNDFFVIETLGALYYKLTPIESATNWYNIRYFMISLYGSGENLIITVDEPIE